MLDSSFPKELDLITQPVGEWDELDWTRFFERDSLFLQPFPDLDQTARQKKDDEDEQGSKDDQVVFPNIHQ